MNNLIQRLLLFFLGIPAVILVILFLPEFNHLAAVLVVIVFSGGCAVELAGLFKARGIAIDRGSFILLGAGIPAAGYLGGLVFQPSIFQGSASSMVLVGGCALAIAFIRFSMARRTESIHATIPKASALTFAAVYPGLLGGVIVLIASEPHYASASLLTFALLAFGNDSIAWFIGVTLGRHRGLIAVSPNKSLEGFLGGLAASIGLAFVCQALFPEALAAAWWKILILGLVDGAAVMLGDLFESALKRSADTKDSGSFVPGRGGFLDSFDSLLFSAPIFYGLSLALSLFR